MSGPFHSSIRTALSNPILQAALDGNAERRQAAFQQAYLSLPQDLTIMRQRAHAIRAETISNLDSNLDKFAAKASSNGMIVHHAADATQALETIRQIARQNNAKTIVKSKTMVGEEIHLNRALEADGLRVIETDLGEYIVQLRGEPPAHIVTPAVHLTRRDVGQTFHEKLGIPMTEDVPTLTQAARRVLRQAFLEADIGISGVNFGVVESGSLCLLTNEGNGRMVTTLPGVHIALMGIERMVPTLQDLALMLYLLPRSATGQKLTVYTNLIQSPRRPGEREGPKERHLVLIDNGRQAIRSSLLAEILYCIRCGACLNVCPVFREIGGHAYVGNEGQNTPYPGPIGSVVSPGLFGLAEFGHLARASSLCGACKEACPVDIDLPKLLLRVRAGGGQSEHASSAIAVPFSLQIGLRLFKWISASASRFYFIQRLAGAASRLISPKSNWLKLPAFTGWGYSRDFPSPAKRPFRALFRASSQEIESPAEQIPQQLADVPSLPRREGPGIDDRPLVEHFKSELTALGGHFTSCQPDELSTHIFTLLNSLGITRIQTWEENTLPPGLLKALAETGMQLVHNADATIAAGLTGALAGIAETGSIVMHSDAKRPLTASLLPEIHIVVLD